MRGLLSFLFMCLCLFGFIGGIGYCFWIGQTLFGIALSAIFALNICAFVGKIKLPTVKDIIG